MTTKNVYREPHWLDPFLPPAHIKRQNPVYTYGARRLNLPENLAESTVLWIMNAAVLVLAAWGIFLLLALMMSSYAPAVVDVVGQLIILFIGLNLFNTLTLDGLTARSTLKEIDEDLLRGRWGLLRVSGLRMNRIVQAKYTLTQLHIWQSLCLVIGLRLAILIILPLHALILRVAFPQFQLFAPLNLPMPPIADPLIMMLVGGFVFVLVGAIWLIEPLWRVRAVTAASLIAASSPADNGLRLLVMTRQMLRFNLECTSLFILMLALCFVGIMGQNPLALICAALLPLLIYNRYQHLTKMWLKQAESRLSELEN